MSGFQLLSEIKPFILKAGLRVEGCLPVSLLPPERAKALGLRIKGQVSARGPDPCSLPLQEPHKLADVPGKQLRLLKGGEVSPTGHV